jgi:hypothetical protein
MEWTLAQQSRFFLDTAHATRARSATLDEGEATVATYRIVCTEQVPVNEPNRRAHIVAVGTGTDPTRYTRRWSLDEVLTAMDRGDRFYTQGVQSGKVANVEKYVCQNCRRVFIRSTADAVADNNLDNLRRCAAPAR